MDEHEPSTSRQERSDEYAHFTACEACRKRKKRCDGRISGCAHCAVKGIPCVYSTNKKTRPVRPSGEALAVKADAIFERLKRLEQAVYESVYRHDGQHALARPRHLQPGPGDHDTLSFEGFSDYEATEARLCLAEKRLNSPSLLTYAANRDNRARFQIEGALAPAPAPLRKSIQGPGGAGAGPDSQLDRHQNIKRGVAQSPLFEGAVKTSTALKTKIFIGASSPFSFFSQGGIEWINEQLGDDSFERLLRQGENAYGQADEHVQLANNALGVFDFPYGGSLHRKLEDPSCYVSEYFSHCNQWLPLFPDADIVKRLPDGEGHPSAWAAAVNIIHGLGAQSLFMKCRDTSLEEAYHSDAWFYLREACKHIPSLVFSPRPPSITAVQAMLGMILFLSETDYAQPSNTLLGLVATTGAQCGFHRDARRFGLSEHEVEFRHNIFWIAYVMDKDISLRTGRPTSLIDLDHDVPLPQSPPHDPRTRLTPEAYLLERVKLALIQSKVVRLLYSSETAYLPPIALRHIVSALSEELEEWRKRCPWTEYGLDELSVRAEKMGVDLLWWGHMMRMRWGFFNCLLCIYRMPFDLKHVETSRNDEDIPGSSVVFDFAHREAVSLVVWASGQNRAAAPKSTICLLTASQFLLFVMALKGGASNSDKNLMRAVGRCIKETDWGSEVARIHSLFSLLGTGLAALTDRV